uniref:Uncharacterized protein n=1 Tax=Minutocellus polymorphus TaxID=265543 RepID=A0A6U0KJH8_9STRA
MASLISTVLRRCSTQVPRLSTRSYTCAITRGIPDTFADALSSQDDSHINISVSKAREEHEQYVKFMRSVLPTVHLPASNDYADSPFVEDTAVVIGNRAVICNIGAKSRKGEVGPIRETMERLGLDIIDMAEESANATVDGGDVLYPISSPAKVETQMVDGKRPATVSKGRHVFVGLSARTNMDGVRVLENAFGGSTGTAGGLEVVPVPIPGISETGALHLKSIVTHVDGNTLLAPTGSLGDEVLGIMKAEERGYEAIRLPDIAACNVVVVNGIVMATPTECQESKQIFESAMEQRGLSIKYLTNVEYAKCDGAMTCRSILLDM